MCNHFCNIAYELMQNNHGTIEFATVAWARVRIVPRRFPPYRENGLERFVAKSTQEHEFRRTVLPGLCFAHYFEKP